MFDGWVKQTAPACAAASVAGAVNACRGIISREDPSMLRQDDVLVILRQILVTRASKRQARMERLLMLPEGGLKPLLDELCRMLADEGKPLGGLKGKCTTATGAVKRLAKLAKTTEEGEGGAAIAAARLRETMADDDSAATPAAVGSDDDENGNDDEDEDKSQKGMQKWKWRKDAKLLLSSLGGLIKLDRKRPSTGAFGNWGISEAIDRIVDAPKLAGCDDGFKSNLLVGKRAKGVAIGLSAKDSEAKIAADWSKLWAAFMDPDTVIIYHLKNHYALVYALRHWVEVDEGTSSRRVVREVLTSRRGQTPKSWIAWEDCRATMLGYSGYKMIAIKRSASKVVA